MILVLSLAILVGGFWVAVATQFQNRMFDLGVHTQAAWSCAFGQPLDVSLWFRPSMLDHHTVPFYCITALSQWISPGSQSLIVMCAVFAALGALLLTVYLNRYGKLAQVLTLVFLAFHPAVLTILNDGPYTNFMNMLWLPLALYFYWQSAWTAFCLFLLLALGTNLEEAVWFVFGFSLYALSERRYKRAGLLFLVAAATIAGLVIYRQQRPLFGSFLFSNFGATPVDAVKNILSHPWYLFFPPEIDIASRGLTLLKLVFSFGIIGFFWRRVYLIVLPHVWTLYALKGFDQVVWKWHYWIPEYAIAALVLADFIGAKFVPWVKKKSAALEKREALAILAMVLVFVVGAAGFVKLKFPSYRRPHWQALGEAMRFIPKDASLAASGPVTFAAAARRCIVEAENLVVEGKCQVNSALNCGEGCPEFALIEGAEQDRQAFERLGYSQVFSQDGVMVLKYVRPTQ